MKKLLVLTGAGMSAESGFSTFRDNDGLWNRYNVEDVATPEGFRRNPSLVLDFYNGLRKQLLEAEPCRGHKLLASLESDYDITVVTQNVDNLHERAGSSNVIHLHGELMKATSSLEPDNPRYVKELAPDNCDIHLGDKAADGSQLRPFIVWFGEAVPRMEEAISVAGQADLFLVIGTSLNVYPAAGLIHYIRPEVPVYLIDPKPVDIRCASDCTHIVKGASEGMENFISLLNKQK
ncbi:MAG: NAD-dependent deacylase [Paraprevotella sp.]|nr:NAD-dependent deacylase [Paraprevotella sp.]